MWRWATAETSSSQQNTSWDVIATFIQGIWVCELGIIAISILNYNIRITDFFSF